MGRYSESIGIWKHVIKGNDGKDVVHKITPEEEDNLKFVEIKTEAAKAKDESILNKGVAKLYFDMVIRSDSTFTDVDKKELKVLISQNIVPIMHDLIIQFKWTTEAKLKEIEDSSGRLRLSLMLKRFLLTSLPFPLHQLEELSLDS